MTLDAALATWWSYAEGNRWGVGLACGLVVAAAVGYLTWRWTERRAGRRR